MAKQVVVVEERNDCLKNIWATLKSENYLVFTATNTSEALRILKKNNEISLVITQLETDEIDGRKLFSKSRELFPEISFIFVSGDGEINSLIELMKKGALYCFERLIDNVKLKALIQEKGDHKIPDQKSMQNLSENIGYANIIGQHKKIQDVFEVIKALAPSDVTALIQGESGVGKELIARAIHNASSRAKHEMVVLNCGALPETLLESELCGHVKGAFTGAISDKAGKFETAHEGTLFLDEVGEIAIHLQVKLLKFLQDRAFERIGGQKVIKTDVRIIAATNRDLRKEVDAGRFRLDLYYRLHVIPVYMPSLKERGDDILLLANHFLNYYTARTGKRMYFSKEAGKILLEYSWPGNVRELENMIQQIVVLCRNEEIQPTDIPLNIQRWEESIEEIPQNGFDLQKKVANIEKRWIENALRQSEWNRTRTAKSLGITRKVLFLKMKKNCIKIPENQCIGLC